jgi:hypothetical protein
VIFDFCDWFSLFQTDYIWTKSSINHGDDLLVTVSSGKGVFSWFLGGFLLFPVDFDHLVWLFLSNADYILANSSSIIHGDNLLVTVSPRKGEFSWFLDVFLLFSVTFDLLDWFFLFKQIVSRPISPLFMGMICWSLSPLDQVSSEAFGAIFCTF